MNNYNPLGRSFNTVRTDNSFQDAGQSTCPLLGYGHDASGKQEIQDFSSIPFQPAVTSNGQDTVEKSMLYQYPGKKHNTYYTVNHRRSWTSSHETYQNAARREYQLLLVNPREANHLITVNYFREYSAQEIGTKWKVLKASLQQQDIIAFVTVEVTTNPHVLPNGEKKFYPINRVHYHCLVDSGLPERQLRTLFKQACFDAGLAGNEFRILYEAIPDRKTFKRKAEYTLKFDNYQDQAILFQPGTDIHKTCSIGRWFINADGTRANKDKMWESIVAGWFPK